MGHAKKAFGTHRRVDFHCNEAFLEKLTACIESPLRKGSRFVRRHSTYLCWSTFTPGDCYGSSPAGGRYPCIPFLGTSRTPHRVASFCFANSWIFFGPLSAPTLTRSFSRVAITKTMQPGGPAVASSSGSARCNHAVPEEGKGHSTTSRTQRPRECKSRLLLRERHEHVRVFIGINAL